MDCSLASFVELQSRSPFCLVSSCYSCCSLRLLLPISKRVSFYCYLELVLILICPTGRSWFFRNFEMYDSYVAFIYCNTQGHSTEALKTTNPQSSLLTTRLACTAMCLLHHHRSRLQSYTVPALVPSREKERESSKYRQIPKSRHADGIDDICSCHSNCRIIFLSSSSPS
jgi:hypothetical protein